MTKQLLGYCVDETICSTSYQVYFCQLNILIFLMEPCRLLKRRRMQLGLLHFGMR